MAQNLQNGERVEVCNPTRFTRREFVGEQGTVLSLTSTEVYVQLDNFGSFFFGERQLRRVRVAVGEKH